MRSIAIARLLTPTSPLLHRAGSDAQQLSHVIDSEGATSATARISMATGRLTVRGGASALMDGDFTYDPELEPQFAYAVRDGRGELRVEQPSRRGLFLHKAHNDWDLRFSNEIPLALGVSLASSSSRFDAEPLNLTALDIESASGGCGIRLGGPKPELREVQARVVSGDLRLRMNGEYGQPMSIIVSTVSGDLEVDLSGVWHASVNVSVRVTSGDISLRVPSNVAVQVRVRSKSGDVRASGLERTGKGLANSLVGVAAVGLDIDVETVSGDIRVDGH